MVLCPARRRANGLIPTRSCHACLIARTLATHTPSLLTRCVAAEAAAEQQQVRRETAAAGRL
jgi:hypothetical protein